ncbi:hypothetical protein Avbf_19019 [Armadillidium vulgare]|nr:hypothetical protein Avbf_19019 [Armadillidium vulgare]
MIVIKIVNEGKSGFIVDNEHPETVKVDIGDPIVLDCRTTRPDIKVSVFKKDYEPLLPYR